MTRVFLIGSGALSACMLPHAVHALRARAPGIELRVGLTRSACRFVSPTALELLTGQPVLIDAWDGDDGGAGGTPPAAGRDSGHAVHVEVGAWAEAFVVHPATAHLLARLALGLCDTPFLTALAATTVPLGVAPNLPPGMLDGAMARRHLAELESRTNVVLAPMHRGRSATTGEVAAGGAGPLTEILGLLGSRYFADDPAWRPLVSPELVPTVGASPPSDGSRSLAGLEFPWSERAR